VQRIVVLASEVDLPVHAAFVSGFGFAIERYSVTYEQSRRSLNASRAAQDKTVTRLALVTDEGRGETRLRSLDQEVTGIAAAVTDRLVRRTNASCRSARTALRAERIDGIHFSGHMRDPIEVAGWSLQLRDGELDCLGALGAVAQHLRLAVLMACSAGAVLTRSRSLDAGFPHALIALGTTAVIAPRRPIADALAAAFSPAFYSALGQGIEVPEAFRQSVAMLIPSYRPGAWSALALHGR
jgi:CHAT domain-containing protein